MATEKTLKTRVKMKHGKESEWKLATNFTPLIGEIIVYDADNNHTSPRLKIGDGLTNVNNLKFVNQDELAKITTLGDELLAVKNGYVPNTRTINSKPLSANISLTASDVGAAASSHTHSYLPLTGGTLTGNLGVNGTITAKTYLAVERNSNPQLALKNANSNPLAVLYTETSDGSYGNTHLQVYKSATESNTFTFDNTGNFRATTLQVDGANNWPSLFFKCKSKTNPGILLQANDSHGFGIYCYGSDLDNASTRYYEGYTFPAPATGLTKNKKYTVYSEKNIIYSSSQPTGVKGAIWLKPV